MSNRLQVPLQLWHPAEMRISGVAPYLIAALLVITAANYGLSRAWGAHPFWAVNIAWFGAPIGIALAFLFRSARWGRRIGIFALLLAGAGFSAHWGRLRFAASFAEDKIAGQFWYFGWMAVAAFAAALLAAILTPGSRYE